MLASSWTAWSAHLDYVSGGVGLVSLSRRVVEQSSPVRGRRRIRLLWRLILRSGSITPAYWRQHQHTLTPGVSEHPPMVHMSAHRCQRREHLSILALIQDTNLYAPPATSECIAWAKRRTTSRNVLSRNASHRGDGCRPVPCELPSRAMHAVVFLSRSLRGVEYVRVRGRVVIHSSVVERPGCRTLVAEVG